MSFKFNVHVSLLMQGVMLPVNSLDCMVIKKYLFGAKNNGTDDTMYVHACMRYILCVPCKLDTSSVLTLSRPVPAPAPFSQVRRADHEAHRGRH